MFDKMLQDLAKLEKGVEVPCTIALDDDCYFDRQCPSPECGVSFKVLFEDWRDKVRDEQAFCPICRQASAAASFNLPAQDEHAVAVGVDHIMRVLREGLSQGLEKFNSRNKGGLISFSMSVDAAPDSVRPRPPEPEDLMQQRFTCEVCGCQYCSIGAAFFCPACGHNSSATMFDRTLDAVRNSIGHLHNIEAALSRDDAADLRRMVLEANIGKLVAAFQRCAEAMFSSTPKSSGIAAPKNVFQRLHDSSDLWQKAIGKRYCDLLSAADLADLTMYFQQRHLLEHRQGIVDQEYITKSGDSTYGVGQRLVVQPVAVRRMADLVDALISAIRAEL